MKSFAMSTLLTCLLIANFTSAHNTTHNITTGSDGVVLSEVSNRNSSACSAPSSLLVSSSASATAHHAKRRKFPTTLQPLCPPYTPGLPLEIPTWEVRDRQAWIQVADGRPLASASTPSTLNATSAQTPTHLHASMVTPPPDLQKRQVPIPYIPSHWRTKVECPAIQGLPCVTVSEYLPYLHGAANKAAEEAARASSLANNGAYVPGMQVPAPSGAELVHIVWYSYGLAVLFTATIYMILLVV